MAEPQNPLQDPKVLQTAERLEAALGVKVTPEIYQDEVRYVLPIPKEKDAQGLIVNAMGAANQVEDRLNEELNKDVGFLKRTFAPDKVHASVYSGPGNTMTRDIAIPARKAEQVIELAEAVKEKDPEAFKKIFPEEMQIRKTSAKSSVSDQRVDHDIKTIIANSQKVLADAGMDLNHDGKVAMNEFRAALAVHDKTPIDAILADVDASKSFNPKEVAALQGRDQNTGKGGR